MEYKVEFIGRTKHYLLKDENGKDYYVIRHINKDDPDDWDIDIWNRSAEDWREFSEIKDKEIIRAIKEFEGGK